MIFHDTLELSLKIGDSVQVMGRGWPLEVEINYVGDGRYAYNEDYTVYGFYHYPIQDCLFNSDKEPQHLFKGLLCNKIRRIIPL